MLVETGRPEALPDYPADGEPPVLVGSGGVMVATRCPGGGEVGLEVWAGDPGLQAPWRAVFDGELETLRNGFDVGDIGDAYHVDAPPGRYRVRADGRSDERGELEAVRFVFPEDSKLTGQRRHNRESEAAGA